MKPIDREIFSLAVPSVLANLTVPLVGMVDIALAGHLSLNSAALIGGISIGSLAFDILYWLFAFLREGTGGLTSQAYGRQDWKDSYSILFRSLAISLLSALILIVLQGIIMKGFFAFADCPPEVRDLAERYFFIRIFAAPATLSLMCIKGWLIGMQDAMGSMYTDLTVNGVNIVASIFLSIGIAGTSFKGYGFEGIAYGTVVAQYSGLLLAVLIIVFKHSKLLDFDSMKSAVRLAAGGHKFKQFFTLNADLFVRSLCLIAVYMAFTLISAKFGVVLLAVCSIMMKLLMIFSYFTDGFAFAGEALTGKYIGRNDRPFVKNVVKRIFVWSAFVSVAFLLAYSLGVEWLLRLMTEDPQVLEASRKFLPWLALMPFAGCAAFVWDGIYTGATATKEMRNSSLACVAAFFLVWLSGSKLAVNQDVVAVHVLFLAYFSHLLVRSLWQTFRFKKAVTLS